MKENLQGEFGQIANAVDALKMLVGSPERGGGLQRGRVNYAVRHRQAVLAADLRGGHAQSRVKRDDLPMLHVQDNLESVSFAFFFGKFFVDLVQANGGHDKADEVLDNRGDNHADLGTFQILEPAGRIDHIHSARSSSSRTSVMSTGCRVPHKWRMSGTGRAARCRASDRNSPIVSCSTIGLRRA